MKRIGPAVAVILAAMAVLAAALYGGAGDVVTLFHEEPGVRGEWRAGALPPDRWVGIVLDREAWDALSESNGAPVFGADAPDFEENVVLVAYMGRRPTGGYQIQITEATYDESAREGGKLTLRIAVSSPEPSDFVTQAITHPADVAPVAKAAWPESLLRRLKERSLVLEARDQDGRDWGPVRVAGSP